MTLEQTDRGLFYGPKQSGETETDKKEKSYSARTCTWIKYDKQMYKIIAWLNSQLIPYIWASI